MELRRRLRLPTASLPTKLTVALSVLVAVVIAGSATLLVERERGERLRRLEERATRIADLLEQSLAQHLWNADSKAIQRQLDVLSPNRELAEVTVTAVGYGTVATVGPRNVSDATGAVVRVRPITYRQFEASRPQTIGEVRVVLTRAEAEAAFARARWAILAMAAAVVLTLYTATSVLLKRMLQTPITRLEAMVDRLAAGDLDARCPVDSGNELGRLAERVNVMADRLRESTARLRESEARFRTFVDHATDAFFLHDDQLTVVDVNRQACESLGYSREDLIGMQPRDFDVGLDEASVAQLAERVGAGETVTFESLHRRKDGTVFPVEIRARRFLQGERRFRYSLVRNITERKRAEAELRATEERFRTLVEFSFDVYWETDAQHRFTRQEFAENLADAPAPGSEIGKTRWEVPYVEPDEEAWRKHRATLDAHLPFRDFELARPTPDGGKRWVSVSGLPMFDSSGRFVGYRGVGRHITERKRVEAELRARQELLDLAQKAARAVAFDWYIGARESENRWSPELEAMYGLEPGTFDRTYQGWKTLVHPDDWPAVKVAINRAHEAGDIAAEYRVIHKDGTVHWLRAKGRMFFDAKGQPERMVGFMIDVTDWRHTEEALRASEAYLTESQRLSHTGSWALDVASDTYVYASEEWLRIYGLDAQEGLLNREAVLRRIAPEDRDSVTASVEKSLREKIDTSNELRIVLPDGMVRHVYVIRHPVLNAARDVVQLVGTSIDITERKRGEEEREKLRQLEADLAHINRVSMMGELTASIAHEVNQPLAGVVSNGSACLRWLAGDVPNLEEAREAARRIVRDGKRAGEVIARVRALTRRAATPTEKLDLNQTIQEVLALVGDEAKRRSAIIRTQFADDLAPVAGDRVQLQQVVLNLVMNGIEAMSSVGERARELVITTLDVDADHVQITVEDSGTGLDPSGMEKIFEPFYTTKAGGMGMGLSICRSILESHGGRLWATAKDSPGTMFHFVLPKHTEEEPHAGVREV